MTLRYNTVYLVNALPGLDSHLQASFSLLFEIGEVADQLTSPGLSVRALRTSRRRALTLKLSASFEMWLRNALALPAARPDYTS